MDPDARAPCPILHHFGIDQNELPGWASWPVAPHYLLPWNETHCSAPLSHHAIQLLDETVYAAEHAKEGGWLIDVGVLKQTLHASV